MDHGGIVCASHELTRPKDDYAWNRFFSDQVATPFIYHGTSTVFEDSIRRFGLSPHPLGASASDALEICRKRGIYGENGELKKLLLILGAERRDGVFLTFDWEHACTYAEMRGGETLHLAAATPWRRSTSSRWPTPKSVCSSKSPEVSTCGFAPAYSMTGASGSLFRSSRTW